MPFLARKAMPSVFFASIALAGNENGIAGGANTGDGAGGVSTNSGGNTNSADGGSGIVVIRYAVT